MQLPGTDHALAWLAYAALTRQVPRARVVELLLQPSHTHATCDQRPDCQVDGKLPRKVQ